MCSNVAALSTPLGNNFCIFVELRGIGSDDRKDKMHHDEVRKSFFGHYTSLNTNCSEGETTLTL